jgi:hypothetical protein
VPVDLRRAEEADVDAPALEPVREHLRHRDDASAVSASSPSPIESGSSLGFAPIVPLS